MAERVSTARILVDGMTCGSCEQRIEKAVAALEGVRRVGASASLSEVMVYYEPDRVGLAAIHEAIRGAGYSVREQSAVAAQTAVAGASAASAERSAAGAPLYRFLGLIAVIAAVYLIIRYTVGFTFLPSVSQSMGYGLIFVVGLLTSLHCIAMCGGIVLSQGIKKGDDEPQQPSGSRVSQFTAGLLPSLLYNGGRVVSYTIIGGAVGALGSLFSLSTALKGVMPIVAGAFMLFLGVRMLGIFPWLSRLKIRFPGLGAGKVSGSRLPQGTLRDRPAQRPHALRTAADHAGLRAGNGELLRRRALDVPVQPRHRAAPAGVRRDQLAPEREVQPPHAQGERRARDGPRPGDVHPGHEPVRRRASQPAGWEGSPQWPWPGSPTGTRRCGPPSSRDSTIPSSCRRGSPCGGS